MDPSRDRLPPSLARSETGLRDFCCAIIDATADLVCAFKPQAAHFAAEGAEDQLREVIAHIRAVSPQTPVILDGKRGDIGSTARFYAREAFERYDADAVTVNPYLGWEAVTPFLAWPGRGVALLCRTSNPGSDWLQGHPPEDPAYLRIAATALTHDEDNLMLVAGATWPDDLARIRAVAGDLPILAPGVGAQGGEIKMVLAAGQDSQGRGLIINASRAVLYAAAPQASLTECVEAARQSAQALCEAMRLG